MSRAKSSYFGHSDLTRLRESARCTLALLRLGALLGYARNGMTTDQLYAAHWDPPDDTDVDDGQDPMDEIPMSARPKWRGLVSAIKQLAERGYVESTPEGMHSITKLGIEYMEWVEGVEDDN